MHIRASAKMREHKSQGMNVKNVKLVTKTHLFLGKYYYLYSSMCIISLNIRIHILAELAREKLI